MQPEITYDWLERLTNMYRAWRGRRRLRDRLGGPESVRPKELPAMKPDWIDRLTNIYRAFRGRRRPLFRPFEQAILAAVEQQLAPSMAGILRDQLAQFNYTARDVEYPDLKRRETILYCFMRGVPFRDFHVKFLVPQGEFQLAELRVQHNRGTTTAAVWLVDGVLATIELRSPETIFEPEGEYTIQSVRVFV